MIDILTLKQMVSLAFSYGNLEMSNLTAAGIVATGLVSIGFFIVASINTDTQGIIDSSIEKFKDD